MQISPLILDALTPKVASLSPLLGSGGPKVAGLSPFPVGGAKVAVTSPLLGGVVPKVASSSPLVDLSGAKINTGRGAFGPRLGPLANEDEAKALVARRQRELAHAQQTLGMYEDQVRRTGHGDPAFHLELRHDVEKAVQAVIVAHDYLHASRRM